MLFSTMLSHMHLLDNTGKVPTRMDFKVHTFLVNNFFFLKEEIPTWFLLECDVSTFNGHMTSDLFCMHIAGDL